MEVVIVLVVLVGACLVVLVSFAWLKHLVEGEGDDVDYGADADEALGEHTPAEHDAALKFLCESKEGRSKMTKWVIYCPKCRCICRSFETRRKARDVACRTVCCLECGYCEWERTLPIAKAEVTFLEDDHGNPMKSDT